MAAAVVALGGAALPAAAQVLVGVRPETVPGSSDRLFAFNPATMVETCSIPVVIPGGPGSGDGCPDPVAEVPSMSPQGLIALIALLLGALTVATRRRVLATVSVHSRTRTP